MGSPILRPWGLSRATGIYVEDPPYEMVEVDPGTQLSVFLDERGEPVAAEDEKSMRRFVTVTVSKRGDGAKDAPNVADDSENDRDYD